MIPEEEAIFDEDNHVRLQGKSRMVFKELIWKDEQKTSHRFLAIK